MSTIREVLDRKGSNVVTIAADTSVLDAIGTMSAANIGAVVVEQGGDATGIFTERDYLRKIALEGRAAESTKVSEVMSSPLITAGPGEATRSAMETFAGIARDRFELRTGRDRAPTVNRGLLF